MTTPFRYQNVELNTALIIDVDGRENRSPKPLTSFGFLVKLTRDLKNSPSTTSNEEF